MNNPDRKPNSHAVLKNLPKKRQAQVFEWCDKENEPDPKRRGRTIPKTGGYAFAQAQLAADGIVISIEVIGRFYHWYEQQKEGRQALKEADDERKMMKKFKPGDARLAREWAEFILLQRAKRTKDLKLLKLAADLTDSRRLIEQQERNGETKAKQKERELELRERTVTLAEFKAQRNFSNLAVKEVHAVKAITRDSSLSTDEQIARVQLKLFGPVPPEYADKFGPFSPSTEGPP